MLRKSNDIVLNLVIAFFIVIIISTQILFLTDSNGYFTIFLPAGVATGLYVSYGKKILPGIVSAIVIGTILGGFVLSSYSFFDSVSMLFPMFFMIIVSLFIFTYCISVFHSKTPNTIKKGILFLISIIITVLFVSIFPALQYASQNETSFLNEYIRFFQMALPGMTIFTLTIVLSNHYDDHFSPSYLRNYNDILFIFIFILSIYIIFSSRIDQFNFTSYAPYFFILFITNAFTFHYRMLIFTSFTYIVIYHVAYFPYNEFSDYLFSPVSSNAILLVIVILTSFIKIIIREIRNKNIELTTSKERFENILDSTINLLRIRENLNYEDENYQENYMKRIFHIAMNIFDIIEYGTCVIEGEKEVKILDVKGYDIDYFNTLHLNKNKFRWNYYKPVLNNEPILIYQSALGERYPLFENNFPKMKQSVSILIKLGAQKNGAITFDILEGSQKVFTSSELHNIEAFQKTINSFYEMNELAIKNNSLKDDIVLSLIRTLELYDQYTGGHSEDVANLSVFIGEKLNLDKNDIYDIYWAGIVHDIGKIGISSDIINKQTKLTQEEYEEVKKHPLSGFEILNHSSDLKTIAKLVKHHHEWYNGSGYPTGLKKDEIPYGSQILQVADSVSSMATRRSYQKEKSFNKIIEELEMYKGTQFNPEIAEIMIELIKDKTIVNYFNNKVQKQD